MARIVVTGASGRLGRALLPQLAAQGVTPVPAGRADGVDLRTGAGLDAVLDGADAVVHAASDPRHAAEVDVAGTARLVEAMERHRTPHVVYVSIVGIETVPWGYYRAKLAAERAVAASRVPSTVVRGTQWFEFVARIGAVCGRFGVAPRGIELAPSDVGEFATIIVRQVLVGARRELVEFGGPERVALTRVARQLSGHRVLHLGVPGRLAASLRAGSLLPGPRALTGTRSWSDWLAAGHAG